MTHPSADAQLPIIMYVKDRITIGHSTLALILVLHLNLKVLFYPPYAQDPEPRGEYRNRQLLLPICGPFSHPTRPQSQAVDEVVQSEDVGLEFDASACLSLPEIQTTQKKGLLLHRFK